MGGAKRPEGETTEALTIPDHEMLRRIGDGSYGEVWLARSATGVLRAVKIVRRDAFDNDKPFEREFNGLLHFEPLSRGHEGLVDILQVGCSSSGDSFYCIMELADAALLPNEDGGSKIEDGLQQHPSNSHPPSSILDPPSYQPLTLDVLIRQRGGRLPVKDCLAIASTLASALQYLHDAGLVHRDIKPSNIIFVGGVPKLADVGLVARTDSARSFVGTEGFVPPEGPGTPRADIYSFGKCLYEMAMGKDRQAFPSPPTLLDELPERAELLELNEVITKACEPDPAQRYATAETMLAELGLLRAGQSVQKARSTKRRWRLLTGFGVTAVLFLAIGGAALWILSRPHLEVVRTLEMPADWHPTPPLVGDWNADGNPDLYLVGEKRAWVVTPTGEIIANNNFEIGAGVYSDLVADVNGDKAAELCLSWRDGTNLHLGVFNHLFAELKHFHAEGAQPRDSSGSYLSSLNARAFADLKNDGKPAVIATRFTGFAKRPRDVCCFDYQTGDLLWFYPVAPAPAKIELVDLDDDGALDLLCGSAAVSNGNKLEDGTDDEHCYLYAISGDGKKLWTQQLGDASVVCVPLVVKAVGREPKAVYVAVSRARLQYGNEVWPAVGYVAKLDPKQGTILRRYEVGAPVNSLISAHLDDGAGARVLLTDDRGLLYKLDSELNLIHKEQIVPCLHTSVILQLTAVEDLDGDGRKELLFASQQVQQVIEENTRGLTGKPEAQHSFDVSLLVCRADLKRLAKHVLRERAESARTIWPVVIPTPGQRQKAIAVIYDKVLFLRYTHR